MAELALEVSGLSKTFKGGAQALDGVSLEVETGEMVALIGASGSGKSTLLRHVAGLVRANRDSQGIVSVLGRQVQERGRIASDAHDIRSDVGMVFQQFNLVGRLTVLTNVLTGLLGKMSWVRGAFARFTDAEKRLAMSALTRVGIADKALARGADLSGGQQQRAAIARTLVQGAKIIVADEPIASLDPSAARRVMDILSDLNREDGITVLVSLHQVEYALNYCKRTVALRDGKVVYDGPSSALTPDFLGELYGAESEGLFLPGLGAGEASKAKSKPKRKKKVNGRAGSTRMGVGAGAAA